MNRFRHRRLVLVLAVAVLVVLAIACGTASAYLVNERPEQLTTGVRRDVETNLPVGASEDEIKHYFTARGWTFGYNGFRDGGYVAQVTDPPGSLIVPVRIIIEVELDGSRRVKTTEVSKHSTMP
jgi:hypothetical protein